MRGRNRSTSILRGLPGSGKSTWAQNWVSDPANTWPHCVISLDAGWDVVADAQHANPEYANELARLATRHGAIWRTEDFDVPLDELLRRNEARPRADHVPEEYIRSSWKRFHHVMFRPLNPEDPNGNLLKRMIADPYVRVTPVRGESDVFACNFTREAFLEGRWNTRTINARGLFVDKNETVVQRGFEKFFAVDEIGSKEDVEALFFCAYRGCSILATAHGKNKESLSKNPYMREIINKKMFQRYVILEQRNQPGYIAKIMDENGVDRKSVV